MAKRVWHPKKLSQAIRESVMDAQRCERSEAYVLNMFTWHMPVGPSGKCAVCMGGSIIAWRLGAPVSKMMDPSLFDDQTRNALWAVDCVRVGSIIDALLIFQGHDHPEGKRIEEFCSEQQLGVMKRWCTKVTKEAKAAVGRADWKLYLEMARELREVGL